MTTAGYVSVLTRLRGSRLSTGAQVCRAAELREPHRGRWATKRSGAGSTKAIRPREQQFGHEIPGRESRAPGCRSGH